MAIIFFYNKWLSLTACQCPIDLPYFSENFTHQFCFVTPGDKSYNGLKHPRLMSSTEVKTYRKKERKKIDLNKFLEVVKLADAMVASKYIMNDHGLEQMVHFPTREKNTLDLILTTLPGQFQDVHSPDKLSDHDIVSGTLRIFIPPIKKPRRKVYLYQKGDYESMRKDTLEFAKEKYFNGHSDTRSVQENFDLLTSFIQDSADKHIPSKTSRSVSSIPWITPEIRRKIRRKNKTHAKAKKTGSSKLRSKFETLRREIKADVRKQHDLYVNNLVGDVKANPRDFYRYINSQKKDTQGIPPLKRKNGKGVAQSDLEKAEEFNGQFTDVFSKNEHTQVPLLDRSAPFMNDIAVSKDGVIKLLKGLNPSKALGPDELHPRVLKELATELGPVFAHLFQQSINTGEIPKEWSLANICPLFKKRQVTCVQLSPSFLDLCTLQVTRTHSMFKYHGSS